MFFAAAVLAILSGLFYAAGHREIGSLDVAMCRALTRSFGSRRSSVMVPLCR